MSFLQAATREGKQLERVVMEALDKCSRSGDTVVTRAEHHLGDTDIEEGEGEGVASRDQDLHTPRYCTVLYCTYLTVLHCTVLWPAGTSTSTHPASATSPGPRRQRTQRQGYLPRRQHSLRTLPSQFSLY